MNLHISTALAISDDLGIGDYREAELLWLAYQANRHVRIAEIGSWMGASTRALADNTRGSIYAIDTWGGGTDAFIIKILKTHPPGWAFAQFSKNTRDLTNLTVIKKNSLAAAEEFLGRGDKFDMIFIDASHDYESVCADIRAWQPLLIPGGMLCGDDYDEKMFPDVVRAVNELLPGALKIAGSLWAVGTSKYQEES